MTVDLATGGRRTAGKVGLGVIKNAVRQEVSKRNLKHILKHLPDFKALDSSFTLEKQVELGKQIAGGLGTLVGTPGGRQEWDAVVTIGGRSVKVRAVLNPEGGLRSVQIRTK